MRKFVRNREHVGDFHAEPEPKPETLIEPKPEPLVIPPVQKKPKKVTGFSK